MLAIEVINTFVYLHHEQNHNEDK